MCFGCCATRATVSEDEREREMRKKYHIQIISLLYLVVLESFSVEFAQFFMQLLLDHVLLILRLSLTSKHVSHIIFKEIFSGDQVYVVLNLNLNSISFSNFRGWPRKNKNNSNSKQLTQILSLLSLPSHKLSKSVIPSSRNKWYAVASTRNILYRKRTHLIRSICV